jgi:hypothetical protein
VTGGGFDPFPIIAAMNRHGVDYVVIGGFAAELHAAAVIPTRDIDLTPSTAPDNLTRLSRALDDLGARVRTGAIPEGLPFSHDGQSLARAGGLEPHVFRERRSSRKALADATARRAEQRRPRRHPPHPRVLVQENKRGDPDANEPPECTVSRSRLGLIEASELRFWGGQIWMT